MLLHLRGQQEPAVTVLAGKGEKAKARRQRLAKLSWSWMAWQKEKNNTRTAEGCYRDLGWL
jgi:hypothetical protein